MMQKLWVCDNDAETVSVWQWCRDYECVTMMQKLWVVTMMQKLWVCDNDAGTKSVWQWCRDCECVTMMQRLWVCDNDADTKSVLQWCSRIPYYLQHCSGPKPAPTPPPPPFIQQWYTHMLIPASLVYIALCSSLRQVRWASVFLSNPWRLANFWGVIFLAAMNSTFNESVCAVLPVQHYLPDPGVLLFFLAAMNSTFNESVCAVLPVHHYLPDSGVLIFLAAMSSTINESACRAACPALPARFWCVDFFDHNEFHNSWKCVPCCLSSTT